MRIALSSRVLLAGVGLLVLAGRAAAQQPSSGAPIEAAMQRYLHALRLVNSDSTAALFTSDADLYEAGMAPLHGREAVRAFLRPFDGKAIVDTATSTTIAVEMHGDTGYLWGEYYQVTRLPPGPFAPYRGRFVSEWRRGPDGQWRIARMLMQPAA